MSDQEMSDEEMSDEELPPELPRKAPPVDQQNAFAFTAANLAWGAPVLGLLLNRVALSLRKTEPDLPGYIVVLDGGSGALFLIGLVFALIALAGISRHGARGLAGKAGLALLVNGFFIAVFATNFLAGRRQAQANDAGLRELAAASRASLEERPADANAVTEPNEEVARLDKLQSKFQQTSEGMSGEKKIIAEAAAGFAKQIRDATQQYAKLGEKFSVDTTLDFSTVQERSDLAARKKHVEQFLLGNDILRNVMTNYAEIYRAELVRLKFPAAQIDNFIDNSIRRAQPIYDIQGQLRDRDEDLGKGAIEALDLMDVYWGKWAFNAEKGYPEFASEDAEDRFNAVADKINAAVDAQQALLKELKTVKVRPK